MAPSSEPVSSTSAPAEDHLLPDSRVLVWLCGRWWVPASGVVLAVILTVASYPHSEYFDAQVHLGGARALLRGDSPYHGAYVTPLWASFFLLPFAALLGTSGFVIWFWANLAAWFAAAVLTLRALRIPLGWPQTLTIAGLLILYPPVVWSTHGQLDFLLGLGLVGFLALMGNCPLASGWRAWLAGMSLALLVVKPHLALVPLALVLLWAIRQRRWQVPLGFGLGVGALAAVAFAIQPSWLGEWISVLREPPIEIARLSPEFAPTVRHSAGLWLPGTAADALSIAVGFGAGCAALWWLWRSRPTPSIAQVVSLGTAVLFLVTPYAQGYDLSLLLFPLVILGAAWLRTGAGRKWLPLGGLLAVYLFPIATVFLRWPQPVLVFSPMLCLAVWLASRRQLAMLPVGLSEHGGAG